MIEPRFYRPIVKTHLKPEQLAARPMPWGREIALLKNLSARYSDHAFWLALGLGFKLNSFAWFKTPGGAVELEQHWRLWQMDRAAYAAALKQGRLNNLLDKASTPATVGPKLGEKPAASAVPAKQSTLQWIDEPTL